MLRKLFEGNSSEQQFRSESLADTVLREKLLDALQVSAEGQVWFRKIFFDTLSKEFKETAQNESLKQVFIEHFHAFLARDGARQDAFVAALVKRRKHLLIAVLKQFGKELENMSDSQHEEALKPLADAFNARQKYPMPFK